MVTLFGTYILAICVGAGCAIINDLFFITSLKHHVLKRHEIITLKQLNNMQIVLIVWIILCEIALFSIQIQTFSLGILLGASMAKILIEIAVLFCVLFIRQMYLPGLIRHQHTYGHLSESFLEHSNGIVGTCATSLVSWFFIVLITSSGFGPTVANAGFVATIVTYIITCLLMSWLFIGLKNRVLHRKRKV